MTGDVLATSDVHRTRNLRARASKIGMTMTKRGDTITMTADGGRPSFVGGLTAAEAWIGQRYSSKSPGPTAHEIPVKWRAAIGLLVTELQAAKRSPATIELRVKRLAAFARAHPASDPLTVTRNDLVNYLAANEGWTPEYAHSVRTSFRVFFGLLHDLEIRDRDPARRLPRIRIPRGLPRPCPDGAVRAALHENQDPRIGLAIRLGAEVGLRRMEIASLRRDAIEGWSGDFRIRIRGKGGHERAVPIDDSLAAELLAAPTVFVFPSPGGGHVTPRHLAKLVSAALPDSWTTHTLRHRYATAAYAATGDIRAVQELLGHQSPATTAVYTKVADESIRRAAMAAKL